MTIYFAEVEDNALVVKGGKHNKDHVDGVSKAILWFLKVFPNYAVDRMLVPPPDSSELPSNIPYDEFRDWDYRLQVKALVISLRQYAPIKEQIYRYLQPPPLPRNESAEHLLKPMEPTTNPCADS